MVVRAVVPVVPQSLSSTPVTAGTGPALHSYDRIMNAAFMSSQAHERGIHAVWPGCWRGQGDGSPVPVRTAAGGEARGTLELGYGRHAEAYEHLRRIHEPGDPACHYLNTRQMLGEFTEAAVRSGHRDEALALARELEPLGRRPPSPWFDLQMLYARLHLADDDEAGAAFEDALSRDLSAWPVIHARIELSYGEWLRRRRRQVESRAPLRAARDAFGALGMHPWAERARQELRAAGESSQRPEHDSLDDLTPQELQIVQMVAQGLSNRVIAERLYLSRRTVESHLYRVFPKLGVSSRAQLVSVLGSKLETASRR